MSDLLLAVLFEPTCSMKQALSQLQAHGGNISNEVQGSDWLSYQEVFDREEEDVEDEEDESLSDDSDSDVELYDNILQR